MLQLMIRLTAIFMTLGTAWYINLVLRGKVRSVPAAWIILSVTNILGLAAYLHSPVHSFAGGIAQITAAASTGSICVVVLWAKRSERTIVFTQFQKGCLAASGLILMVWAVLRFGAHWHYAPVVSNILAQVVMVIGYSPLVIRLDRERKEMESVVMWAAICTASLSGMFAAWMKMDALGYIYGARGVVCSALVVYLVLKIRSYSNSHQTGASYT